MRFWPETGSRLSNQRRKQTGEVGAGGERCWGGGDEVGGGVNECESGESGGGGGGGGGEGRG